MRNRRKLKLKRSSNKDPMFVIRALYSVKDAERVLKMYEHLDRKQSRISRAIRIFNVLGKFNSRLYYYKSAITLI